MYKMTNNKQKKQVHNIITIESSTNGETTLSRMNLSGYVGHATIFS